MDVNRFLQDDLVKIGNTSQVFDHQVHLTFQTLLVNGEAQFLKGWLINRTTVIDASVKKINYKLPENINEKMKLQ